VSPTYPLELRLQGRRCVVVGGGQVAARKVRALVRAGADVRVVAPQIAPSILSIRQVRCRTQRYRAAVLRGATLVFACTDDPAVNRRVARDARAIGAWVNVADDPENCDFLVPATLERGHFRISISTGGASPQLAATIRRRLESRFGPQYGILVEELRRARATVQKRVADPDRRRRIYEALCTERSIRLISTRDAAAWRSWFEKVLAQHLDANTSPGRPR